MAADEIEKIVRALGEGKISPEKALERLKHYPTENMGVAAIDHHRTVRQGFPEVVYCEGKSEADVVAIVRRMAKTGHPVLATRASASSFKKIKKFAKSAVFHERCRAIVIEPVKRPRVGKILVLSAGTSDVPVAEEAAVTAMTMGSAVETVYDVGVAGIHRLFNHMDKIRSARVIVVAAGMDGALASVAGGLAPCPVIAVPTSVGYGAAFGGVSALLSMLNSCAAGVAVMNIDNGFGAGALAHKINTMTGIAEKKK
ncbi:MAG: nickel pincer cofactor biosynthesis protein LarB [Nitrospinae bacterium]|nr:nickel pincer cofactor biosynthesis protein LarB [Nitrospinota bacterium]